MHLQERINLLTRLGRYMREDGQEWALAKQKATAENPWFIPAFIELAIDNICGAFLQEDKLLSWAAAYHLPEANTNPKNIGIVMAGNIPMVGFHDFLSAFISGHRQTMKLSAKDKALLTHLVEKMRSWDPQFAGNVNIADMLKGCDAYIATGSNNSSRYF